jgi:DNA repair exonuclease SbcCD ATPase subunit
MAKSAQRINDLKTKMAGISDTKMPVEEVKKYNDEIRTARQEYYALIKKSQELAKLRMPTESYQKAIAQIERLESVLGKVAQKQASGGELTDEGQAKVERLKKNLAEWQTYKKQLESSDKAYVGGDAEYQATRQELAKASERLKDAKNAYDTARTDFQRTQQVSHAQVNQELIKEQEQLNKLTRAYQKELQTSALANRQEINPNNMKEAKSSVSSLKDEMDTTSKKVKELRVEMARMEKEKAVYDSTRQSVKKYKQELDKAIESFQHLAEEAEKVGSTTFSSQKYQKTLATITELRKGLEQLLKTSSMSDDNEYNSLMVKTMANLEKLKSYKQELQTNGTDYVKGTDSKQYQAIQEQIRQAADTLIEVERKYEEARAKFSEAEQSEYGKVVAEFNEANIKSDALHDTFLKAQESVAKASREILTEVEKDREAVKDKPFTVEANTESIKKAKKELATMGREIEKASSKIQTLEDKMIEVGNAKTPTEEYKSFEEVIAKAEKRIEVLQARRKALEDAGNKNYKTYDNAGREMEALEAEIRQARKEIQMLVDEGKDFTLGYTTEEFTNLTAQLQEQRANVEKLRQAYEQAESAISDAEKQVAENGEEQTNQSVTGWERVKQAVSNAVNAMMQNSNPAVASIGAIINTCGELASAFGNIVSTAVSVGRRITSAFGTAISVLHNVISTAKKVTSVFRTVYNAVKKVVTAVGSLLKKVMTLGLSFATFGGKATKALKSVTGHANTSGNAITKLGKRILNLAKRAFIFSLITKGFSAIKNNISDAFSSYLKHDTKLKKSVTELRVALKSLSANIVAAFAPIISIVVPYLTQFVNWLIKGVNAVGAFFAALTGKTSYKVATASVKALGDEADSTSKKVDKLKKTLGAYDELNVITQNTDTDTDDGLTWSDATVDNAVSDFAEKLKKAWEEADFTEIGNIIGTKLKNALDSIDWEGIKTVSAKIGKSLATFINGFVETSGLDTSVGKTVGELLNTGISGADAFVTNLHFDSLGDFVADAMNKAIETIEWKKAGEVIQKGLNGVFELAETWSEKFHFEELGNSVKDLINSALGGIEWKTAITASENIGKGIADALNAVMTESTFNNIGKTVAGVVNTVISGAYSFIDSAKWTDWGKAVASGINTVISDIDWEKASDGVKKAVKGFANFFNTIIYDTDFGAIGETLSTVISTALNGISTFFETVDFVAIGSQFVNLLAGIDWLTLLGDVAEVIGSMLLAALELVFGVGATLVSRLLELGASIVEGLFKGVTDALANIGTWLKEHLVDPFIDGIKDLFGIHSPSTKMAEIGGYLIEGLLNGITDGVSGIADWLKTNVVDKVLDGVSAVKDIVVNVGGKIGDTFTAAKDAFDSVKDKAAEVLTSAKEKATGAFSTMADKFANVKDKAAEVLTSAKEKATGALSSMKDKWDSIKSKTSTLTSKLSNKVKSATLSTVKSAWNTIKSKTSTLTSKLSDKTGKKLSTVKNAWEIVKTGTSTLTANLKQGWKGTFTKWLTGNEKGEVKVIAKITKAKNSGAYDPVNDVYDAKGAIHQNGKRFSLPQFSTGGLINAIGNIARFATGGLPSHGTMFVAGENGSEIVGNIGGRTEVLNKSQIASAIYSAVVSGMSTVLGQYVNAILNTQIDCANAIIQSLSLAQTIPDTSYINAIRDGINSSNVITSNDTSWIDRLAEKINTGGNYTFVAQLDGRTIFKETVTQNNLYRTQTGRSAFE